MWKTHFREESALCYLTVKYGVCSHWLLTQAHRVWDKEVWTPCPPWPHSPPPPPGGVANTSGHRLKGAQARSGQGSLLQTQQRLLAQGLEALATGPCAQVMSQWAPCVVSIGERGVETSGNRSGLEIRIFPESSHSYHPLGHQRACLHSEQWQDGLCFWWYPQDRASSLTCRSVRALDLKVCPFLPKVYLMEEMASPYSPVSLPSTQHLAYTLSPPWHQPNHFYFSCWHQEGNTFSSSIWWLLKTKRRFCSPITPLFLFLRKIWVVCTSYKANAIKRLHG